jgi:hypothetical protein
MHPAVVFPVVHGAIADASLDHARLHPHLAVHVNDDARFAFAHSDDHHTAWPAMTLRVNPRLPTFGLTDRREPVLALRGPDAGA